MDSYQNIIVKYPDIHGIDKPLIGDLQNESRGIISHIFSDYVIMLVGDIYSISNRHTGKL